MTIGCGEDRAAVIRMVHGQSYVIIISSRSVCYRRVESMRRTGKMKGIARHFMLKVLQEWLTRIRNLALTCNEAAGKAQLESRIVS